MTLQYLLPHVIEINLKAKEKSELEIALENELNTSHVSEIAEPGIINFSHPRNYSVDNQNSNNRPVYKVSA